jgi:hypothetical protein
MTQPFSSGGSTYLRCSPRVSATQHALADSPELAPLIKLTQVIATAVALALLGGMRWFGWARYLVERSRVRCCSPGRGTGPDGQRFELAGRRASSNAPEVGTVCRSMPLLIPYAGAENERAQCRFGATIATRGRYILHELPSGDSGVLPAGELVLRGGPARGNASHVERDTAPCRCMGLGFPTRTPSRPRLAWM